MFSRYVVNVTDHYLTLLDVGVNGALDVREGALHDFHIVKDLRDYFGHPYTMWLQFSAEMPPAVGCEPGDPMPLFRQTPYGR